MTGNMIQNMRFSIPEVKLTEGEAPNIFNNNDQKYYREEKKLQKIIYKFTWTIVRHISECLLLS